MTINKLDVQLFIGPRRCGKSEYVENILSKFKRRLYVGTLWKEPRFEELLRIHRERRDTSWKLVECVGKISKDKLNIVSVLQQMVPPCCCMVDGLTTWAIHNAKKNADLFGASRGVAYGLEELIYNNAYVTWKLVDVCPSSFSSTESNIYSHACSIIHGLLKTFIPGIEIIKWEEYANGTLSNSLGR
jgi:adenosyl cobinamide kinase/adenosyl cobinamide phosphate guanylyltransferase